MKGHEPQLAASPCTEARKWNQNVYRVPKWIVWVTMTLAGAALVSFVADWAMHVNWPPVEGRNEALIKSLNCDKPPGYMVTDEMLRGDTSGKSFQPVGVDRRAFIDKPACVAAGVYLGYEGSGIRNEFNVYDMSRKRRTARIVITHEKFVHQ